jgi:hypothetical protein
MGNSLEFHDGSAYLPVGIGPPGPATFAWVQTNTPTPRAVGDLWVNPNDPLMTWDTAWKFPTLLNGWANYSAAPWSSDVARYRMLPGGLVCISGFVAKAANPNANSTVFNLPADYRPYASLHLSVPCNGSTPDNPERLVLNIMSVAEGNRAAGDVSLQMSGASQNQWSWVSLDGISFVAQGV